MTAPMHLLMAIALGVCLLVGCVSGAADHYGVTDSTRGALVVGTKSPVELASVQVRGVIPGARVTVLQLCADCWRNDSVRPATPNVPIPVVHSLPAGHYSLEVGYEEANPLGPYVQSGTLTDTFTVRPGQAVIFMLRGGDTLMRPDRPAPQYRPVWLGREVLMEGSDFLGMLLILCVPVVLAGFVAAGLAKSSTPRWRLPAWVPVLPLVAVATRILVDGARNPTSHNLWPFEMVFASLVSLLLFGAFRVVRSLFGK